MEKLKGLYWDLRYSTVWAYLVVVIWAVGISTLVLLLPLSYYDYKKAEDFLSKTEYEEAKGVVHSIEIHEPGIGRKSFYVIIKFQDGSSFFLIDGLMNMCDWKKSWRMCIRVMRSAY